MLAALLVGFVPLVPAEYLADKQPIANSVSSPQARFASLADGEALDLGPYECESRVPGIDCYMIFDFSRINYDPYGHRILAFGGGHAATGRTDVDVFDLNTLKWNSLYPSMSCDEVSAGEIDPRGFHTKTEHPVARHTYDQNVIVEYEGTGRMLMFSTEGFRGRCHPYKAKIGAVAALSLSQPNGQWSFTDEMPMPWGYAGSAEFDPVSGMVILMGGQHRGMWVYDPMKERIVASLPHVARASNSSNLLYSSSEDRMYLIDSKTLGVRVFTLDRKDWQESTESTIETKGVQPQAFRNFAYDSHNHVLGGIVDGIFYAFDVSAKAWQSFPVVERSASGMRIGTVWQHAIDYDPVNNVFILVSGRPGSLRTWAYRFRN